MRFLICLFITLFSFNAFAGDITMSSDYTPQADIQNTRPSGYPVATLAGGCFWCMESEFRRLSGVLFTESGYAGEANRAVTYNEVSRGDTGFREVIQVVFDPAKISYEQILRHFMLQSHDPTQTDGQGVNIGFQYTSAIYASNDEQLRQAQTVIADLKAEKAFKNPIATEIIALKHYVKAEDYHQQYYEAYEDKTGRKHINILIKERKLK